VPVSKTPKISYMMEPMTATILPFKPRSHFEKTIIVDCDEALLAWTPGFLRHVIQRGFGITPGHKGIWHEQFFNNPTKEPFSLDQKNSEVDVFNNTAAFAELAPYRDAVDGIAALRAQGYHIHVVSACGTSTATKKFRIANLRAVFGQDTFSSFEFVGLGESKEGKLRKWQDSGFFFVDDQYKNMAPAIVTGLTPVLMHDEWNSGLQWDGLRISTFADLLAIIEKDCGAKARREMGYRDHAKLHVS